MGQAHKAEHIKAMTALALRPERPAALTILPEAAIAGFWRDDEGLVRALANAITPENGVMLTGILSSDMENNFYNSAYFVHQSGGLLGQYHKQHLVPFWRIYPLSPAPLYRGDSRSGGI